MKELTKAEEQVMQILWELDKAFVKEIVEEFPDPKPAYNTVSTIVRILEKKGFIGHEAFGKSHRYYPTIEKKDYRNFSFGNLYKQYFSGSPQSLLSYFVKENDIDTKELEEILKHIKKENNE